MREPARLLVRESADEVRRAVGPTAWAALEVLAAHSVRVDDERRVAASARQIASALGLSKNAAHRAMRRLVEAGFAAPAQARAADGRYFVGSYLLTIPADALRVETDSDVVPAIDANPRPRVSRRLRVADRGLQLDLLTDAG